MTVRDMAVAVPALELGGLARSRLCSKILKPWIYGRGV